MTFVLGIIGSIGKFFADVAGAALKWAGVFLAFRVGKRKAQQEAAAKNLEVKDEQLKHAARRPRDRSDIIERMRDNEL